MSFSFRPARRQNTPLILGISGPTKSGKTMSAHRLAVGLSKGGKVVMVNTEGARGHCYADQFSYVACDLEPPYRPSQYTAALQAVGAESPAVVILDSVSHMHDGPGGVLEMHEEELDRMAGTDYKKRERCTFSAWIAPKRQENAFIYQLLSMDIPVILCMRAKEKIKIVKGGEPIELGWQPIVGERVAFETIFTLMLPPHSKGTPDLSQSDMRTPFDKMVQAGRQIDEELGEQLAQWASGSTTMAQALITPPVPFETTSEPDSGDETKDSTRIADLPPKEQAAAINAFWMAMKKKGADKANVLNQIGSEGFDGVASMTLNQVSKFIATYRP